MVSKPKWLQIAEDIQGLKEIPGPSHNKTILSMLESLTSFNGSGVNLNYSAVAANAKMGFMLAIEQ